MKPLFAWAPKSKLDITKPEDAREFLNKLRLGPNKQRVKFVTDDKGTQFEIEQAPDELVVKIANELH